MGWTVLRIGVSSSLRTGEHPDDRGDCQPVAPADDRRHARGHDIGRRFSDKTQADDIRHVKTFADFLGRSPARASAEDLRRWHLHLTASGASVSSINAAVSALRFFYKVTLGRREMIEQMPFLREPQRLPVVLSPDEAARLLRAAPGLTYRAALSVAYGAGLRASEVTGLQVGDIDSERMLIRVQQGKGRKDRYVMLSAHLRDLLRAWWKVGRPRGWLFFGRDPVQPMTTRPLNRACHAAADEAGIDKRVSLHTLRLPSLFLWWHKKLDTTARYTRVALETIRQVISPLEYLARSDSEKAPPPA